LTIWKIYY